MQSKNKVYLCSFASPDLLRSAQRFYKQAESMNFYDNIKVFTKDDLGENILIKIENRLKKNKRGYGFWLWKPQIILDTFKKLEEGDIVNYCDVGCHFNTNGKKRLSDYVKYLENSQESILAFQFYPKDNNNEIEYPKREEFQWTKADIFEEFKTLNDNKITHTPQFITTTFFIKKNHFTINFLNKWLEKCENFHLSNDDESKIKNFEGFVENRHDQSLFSILCKLHNIKSCSAYEVDWAIYKNERTWKHLKDYPILAKRDKKYNFIKRFLNRQLRTFRRFFS